MNDFKKRCGSKVCVQLYMCAHTVKENALGKI